MRASVCLGVARERAAADSGPTPKRAVTAARTAGGAAAGCARRARASGCAGPAQGSSGRAVAVEAKAPAGADGPAHAATTRATPRTSAPATGVDPGPDPRVAPLAARSAAFAASAARSSATTTFASNAPHWTRAADAPATSSTAAHGTPTRHRRSAARGSRERASRPKDLYHPTRAATRAHGRLRRAVDVRQQRGHLRLNAPFTIVWSWGAEEGATRANRCAGRGAQSLRNTAALETRSVVASFSGWFKSPARDASDAGRRARPSAMASSLAPERVRYVRVAVVGDTGCGKSTLVRHLAGDPRDELVERTTGVNARVRLVDVPDPRTGAPRPHFVELWDVGCRDEHKIERRVFYADLDGVLLVHDLSLRRSARRLRKWAREIAASATFASPTPDHCDWSVGVDAVRGTPDAPHVLRGFGGLPVPALVVANKADLDRGAARARRRRRTAARSTRARRSSKPRAPCGFESPRRFGSRPAWRGGVGDAKNQTRGGLLPTTVGDLRRALSADQLFDNDDSGGAGGGPSNGEPTLPAGGGLRCVATDGRVDVAAMDDFFRELIARRHERPDGPTRVRAAAAAAAVGITEAPGSRSLAGAVRIRRGGVRGSDATRVHRDVDGGRSIGCGI